MKSRQNNSLFRKSTFRYFPASSKKFPASFCREFPPKRLKKLRKQTRAFGQNRVFRGKFPAKGPLAGNFGVGDRFAYDCAHHHPALANRTFPLRRQIGRFCRDFRPFNLRILSLQAFVRLNDDFGRSVSASRNSVPGGCGFARSWRQRTHRTGRSPYHGAEP